MTTHYATRLLRQAADLIESAGIDNSNPIEVDLDRFTCVLQMTVQAEDFLRMCKGHDVTITSGAPGAMQAAYVAAESPHDFSDRAEMTVHATLNREQVATLSQEAADTMAPVSVRVRRWEVKA
jgi:hypothetical protein